MMIRSSFLHRTPQSPKDFHCEFGNPPLSEDSVHSHIEPSFSRSLYKLQRKASSTRKDSSFAKMSDGAVCIVRIHSIGVSGFGGGVVHAGVGGSYARLEGSEPPIMFQISFSCVMHSKSSYTMSLHVLEQRGSIYNWNIVRPKDWPRCSDYLFGSKWSS